MSEGITARRRALADSGAEPRFFDDLKNLIRVTDSLHRQRARRPTFDEFRDPKSRRRSDGRSRVRRLHGPDTLLQPIEQREIVGGATKDCLAEVNVSLDETRYDRTTGGIDHNIC